MKQRKGLLWILILWMAALGIAAYAAAPRVPVLVLRDESGQVRARIVCTDGRFVHRYVHSVHLSDVDEEYGIDPDNTLHLAATRFDTLGVGIPYDAEGGFSVEGNRFVLKMNRRFRSLPIRVSPLPGHMIIAGGREYPLTEWFAPEDLVTVEAKHRLRRLFRRGG